MLFFLAIILASCTSPTTITKVISINQSSIINRDIFVEKKDNFYFIIDPLDMKFEKEKESALNILRIKRGASIKVIESQSTYETIGSVWGSRTFSSPSFITYKLQVTISTGEVIEVLYWPPSDAGWGVDDDFHPNGEKSLFFLDLTK